MIQSASWRRRFPPFNLLHDLRFILRDPRDKRRKASSMQSLALQAPMIQFRRKQGTKLPCDYFCVYHLHVRKEHRAAFCSINSSRPLQCYRELGTCLSLSWIICNCTYIFWEVTHWSKENCIIQTYSKFPKSSDESFFFFFSAYLVFHGNTLGTCPEENLGIIMVVLKWQDYGCLFFVFSNLLSSKFCFVF